MALPQVPRRIALVEAPTTRNMAAQPDAASPYKMLAKTLDEAGDATEKVAVAAATRAGEDAVQKDEAGNIIIDRSPLPIIGKAGAEFERAARTTALAKLDPEIQNKATEIRLQFPNDPQSFETAWKEYGDKLASGYDPIMRPSVSKIVDREGGQNYRGLLVQTDNYNTANALESYKSRLTELDNRGAALARQGGVGTPEYADVRESVDTLYGELSKDGRFKYPADRVAQERDAMASRHKGEAVIGTAMSIFDKATPQSAAEARKFLQESAYDPALNLTPAQRSQIVTRGMGALEGKTSENKAQVDANKKLVGETIEGLKTAAPYDIRRFNDLLEKSAALGDVESYYKLSSYQTMHAWRQSISVLPIPQQVEALSQMRGGVKSERAGSIYQTLAKDWGPAGAAGILGNLLQEGPLDPRLSHDGGTGIGIAGWRLERRQALRQFAASRGTSEGDLDTQVAFIGHELNTTEKAVGDRLRKAKSPEEAAQIFIDYERPQGWTPEAPQRGHGFGNRIANAQAAAITHGGQLPLGGPPQFAPYSLDAQESNLIEYHRDHLRRGTYLDDKGDLSTVYITGITGPDGRIYNVPGYWSGQLHKDPDEIREHAAKAGWDKWPSYANGAEADAAAVRVHGIVESDTTAFRQQRERSTAARPWAEAVRQEAVNDVTKGLGARAESMVATLETAVGKGRTPSDQEIRDVATLLNETGRRDLFDRVDGALATHDASRAVTNMPVGARQSFQAQMQALAADKSDPRERRVIDATAEAVKNVEQGMKTLPYSTGAQRGLHSPPGPLDFSNPDALGAEFNRRNAMDLLHQNHDGVSAKSIFEGQEGEAFKAALISGDAKVVAGTFGALQRLGDDQLAATLSGDSVKDGIRGALRTTDPGKFNALMTSLDAVYARAPETFAKSFGEDATHALMTWQSNTRYMTPEAMAKERERSSLDPQVRERMKHLETEGRTEAGKVSFTDVVKNFDTSWWITPGPLARAVGSQPLSPADPLTQATLMGDFSTQFARRYAETNGDKDTALKQTMELMKTKWTASPVNGGRLMVNAPETIRDRAGQAVYPAVNGEYRWMTDQIEREIGLELGKPITEFDAKEMPKPMFTDDVSGAGRQNWSYTLVSDRRTQAEAQNGQRASYQVVVTDAATGRATVMPKRFQFDPSDAQSKARADFSQQRTRVLGDLQTLQDILPTGGL